ncbi:hypothetical protein [Leptolyngbya sp. PL-A3]
MARFVRAITGIACNRSNEPGHGSRSTGSDECLAPIPLTSLRRSPDQNNY